MNTKYEPCSICEQYIEGVVCTYDKCPVAKMKAEIEEHKSEISILKDSNKNLQELYQNEREKVAKSKQKVIEIAKALKTAKNEAIKEFAERLKKDFKKSFYCNSKYVVVEINNLMKEMTEGEKC